MIKLNVEIQLSQTKKKELNLKQFSYHRNRI